MTSAGRDNPAVPPRAGELPRVSVVVPCYNYGRFLEQCVRSALDQPDVDVDVTIVDDASSDDSPHIAQRLASDPRVRLVRHSTNRGHIHTFTESLSLATGEYVVKLDADDVLPIGSLARSASLLRARPSVGFVYGRPVEFHHVTPAGLSQRVRSWSVWSGQDWIARRCRSGRNTIMQPEVMMRREVLAEVGGHRPEVPGASDLHLWLRFALIADVGRVNGPVQGLYRIHPDSMQRTIHAGMLNDLRQRRDAFELFFSEAGPRLRRRGLLDSQVHHRLAVESLRHALRELAGPGADRSSVRGLLEFARSCDAQIKTSALWNTVERYEADSSSATFWRPAWTARRAAEAVRSRVAWRHWQWTGL